MDKDTDLNVCLKVRSMSLLRIKITPKNITHKTITNGTVPVSNACSREHSFFFSVKKKGLGNGALSICS